MRHEPEICGYMWVGGLRGGRTRLLLVEYNSILRIYA
jgi:hypothetical protein